jgi:hypothetical protein
MIALFWSYRAWRRLGLRRRAALRAAWTGRYAGTIRFDGKRTKHWP